MSGAMSVRPSTTALGRCRARAWKQAPAPASPEGRARSGRRHSGRCCSSVLAGAGAWLGAAYRKGPVSVRWRGLWRGPVWLFFQPLIVQPRSRFRFRLTRLAPIGFARVRIGSSRVTIEAKPTGQPSPRVAARFGPRGWPNLKTSHGRAECAQRTKEAEHEQGLVTFYWLMGRLFHCGNRSG